MISNETWEDNIINHQHQPTRLYGLVTWEVILLSIEITWTTVGRGKTLEHRPTIVRTLSGK